MEEGSSGNVGDRRPDLLPCMDDIDSKRINCIPTNVITVHTRNQDFSFVIVNEKASNHDES